MSLRTSSQTGVAAPPDFQKKRQFQVLNLPETIKKSGGKSMITHKQFPDHKVYEMEIGGRPFTVETG